MRKFILFILVFFFAGLLLPGTKIVPLPDIYRPFLMFENAGYLYIVEGTTIYIYREKDFKLIKKFGKQGEGPQEFKGSIHGKFIKRVFLPSVEKDGFEYWNYRYTVGGGKLYQLAENEDTEEWELYITEID